MVLLKAEIFILHINIFITLCVKEPPQRLKNAQTNFKLPSVCKVPDNSPKKKLETNFS